MIIESLQRLYERIYGNYYDKKIFDNNIASALAIILSDKQTSITPETLASAIDKAIVRKQNVIIKNDNHKIVVNVDSGRIEMSGKNINGGKFQVTFKLNENTFDIENNCEVTYRDSKIVCDIPEQFLGMAARKNETSYFYLPDEYKNTDDKVKILYTTAISSINRALGTEKLEDEDLDWLMEGKRLETSQGFACFDEKGVLQIYSNKGHVITKKSYEAIGDKVIYKKQEMSRVAKDEYAYLDTSKRTTIEPLIQQIEVLEQSNILYNHSIYIWNKSMRECPDDYKIYQDQIDDAYQNIKNNTNKIKELKEQINLKISNKR